MYFINIYFGFSDIRKYILIIPDFGIISIVISVITQIIIFGNQSTIIATICISVLGGVVRCHHMYIDWVEIDTRDYFTAVTMTISLPTGTKIFNLLCTYLRPYGISFFIVFIFLFLLGVEHYLL